MSNKRIFILRDKDRRLRAARFAVEECPADWQVTFSEPNRNSSQNARLHAMLGDVARQCEWMQKKRTPAQWKVLMVSGHAVATKAGAELVPGLEGEFVNLRESTAAMSVRRCASLITYIQAWGDMNGVEWSEDSRAQPKEHA